MLAPLALSRSACGSLRRPRAIRQCATSCGLSIRPLHMISLAYLLSERMSGEDADGACNTDCLFVGAARHAIDHGPRVYVRRSRFPLHRAGNGLCSTQSDILIFAQLLMRGGSLGQAALTRDA